MKNFSFLLFTCLFLAFNCSVFANEYNIEKIIYEDEEEQSTVDEELFDDSEENNEYEETIILSPQKKQFSKPLKAVIEKNYKYDKVEAYNTFWDDSLNFRTLFLTNPSTVLRTVPSVIHSAHYKFMPDENTAIFWGNSPLSSQNGISAGFVGKLESDYDSGLKINTKIGGVNVSAAIYESIETLNPSGGVLVSSNDIFFKNIKGSFRFGGGVYANQNTDEKDSLNAGGLFSKYSLGRFSIGAQIGESQYNNSRGKYGTSLYLYPELQITKSLYLTSKIANHLDQKYNQKVLGLTYKPFQNNPNEFSLNIKATLYDGEGTKDKQRFELSTKFKF